jgi:uncharacterized protein DUF6703
VTAPKSQQPGEQQTGTSRHGRGRAEWLRPLPLSRFQPPQGPGARRALERSTGRLLVYLSQLPRWLPPLVLTVLLLVGLTVPGWGAIPLVAVAGLLGWLAALSWPALDLRGRLLRLAGVACLLILAAIQATR